MTDLNHVTIIGRLTRDAEMKYTAGGMAISKFAIAVNRRKKSGDQWTDEASFFDVSLWGKTAEAVNQYLLKGKQIAVDGELRQERWTAQDGTNRSRVEIAANNVQLLGGGQGSTQSAPGVESHQPYGASPSSAPSGSARGNDGGFDDDIPW